MRRNRSLATLAVALVAGSFAALAAGAAFAAAQTAAQPVPGALDGGVVGPTLRMIVSLAAVLALVAGLAWLAQRLRAGGKIRSGLIEVVSGVSLGAREKVVLLRVGQEQVLVGVSPAGMRALHVMKDPAAPAPFAGYMEKTP